MAWTDDERNGFAERFADRRIFISIAASGDPDLARSIRSAFDTATRPAQLRFGIYQVDDRFAADLGAFATDPRLEVDRDELRQPGSIGWARARANALYDGEPYLLQIDPPARFVDGWDQRLIELLESSGSPRPIMAIAPSAAALGEGDPAWAVAGRPTRLTAGGLFTHGRFVHDVPADPDITLEVEDDTVSIRAYTHGYDFFAPPLCLIERPEPHVTLRAWTSDGEHAGLIETARRKAERLTRGDDRGMGRYGLGRLRTGAAYEHFTSRFGDMSPGRLRRATR